MTTSTILEIKTRVVQIKKLNASILVIDSDPGFCIVLGIMLKLYDYGVHRAHSKSEAIAAIEDQTPDIIICNMKIFSEDENNLMTYLRSYRSLAKIPILVVAAEAQAVNSSSANHKAASAFIVKPFTAIEVQQSILSLLD